jgi:hypothetical protein
MANESYLQFGGLNVLKENARDFAETDYLLRVGTHIQNVQHQALTYRFLVKNETVLKAYYQDFFRITLESEGNVQDGEKFYYLLPKILEACVPIELKRCLINIFFLRFICFTFTK